MSDETQKIRIAELSQDKHGAWYLVTGLILGLILGIIYARWVNPIIYEYAEPASLNEEDKDIYRSIIALAYAKTGNAVRALRRLALLEDTDPFLLLGLQAQRALAQGNDEEARALALLASMHQPVSDPTAETIEPLQSLPEPAATLQRIPTQSLPIQTRTP